MKNIRLSSDAAATLISCEATDQDMQLAAMPRPVRDLLASCPKAGKGVHRWLFKAALKLHNIVHDKDQIVEMLREASANCGRGVSDKELANAVSNSAPIAAGEASGSSRRPRWPFHNLELVRKILRSGPSLQELEASSPVRWDDGQRHTEKVIDCLFPGNPLICAGGRKERAITRSREEWRGFLDKQQFIVPSPMAATRGVTQNGDKSMRTLANTGQRQFLVVEFDQGAFDEHAKLLTHLGQFAPLALVVHSGNKSLHGWFQCKGETEEKIEKFFSHAVSIGADRATWTRCQWVRMPDGQRENGKIQRVVFFNPDAVLI